MAYVKPPADEARRVGNRVLYELEMMAGLVERMDRFDELLRAELPDNELVRDLLAAAGRNADIESFALHARAMLAFLFGPKRRPDDVIARDFFETDGDWRGARLAKPVELDGLPDRVSRSLAHLTYRGADELGHRWIPKLLWEAFAPVLGQFFIAASPHRLDDATRQVALVILTETSRWLPPAEGTSERAQPSLPPVTPIPAMPIQGGTVLSHLPARDPFARGS